MRCKSSTVPAAVTGNGSTYATELCSGRRRASNAGSQKTCQHRRQRKGRELPFAWKTSNIEASPMTTFGVDAGRIKNVPAYLESFYETLFVFGRNDLFNGP